MEQITTSVSELGSKISERIDKIETHTGYETREAQIIKSNISQYWNNELNERKTAYWKHYRSMKLAELYEAICSEENPFVPRKFRMKVQESAAQDEKELRGKQSIQHLRDEIDVLKLRSTNFEKQFQDTDSRALRHLDEQTDDSKVKNCLKNLWNNDCKREESITHDIWKSKEDFLRSTFDKEKSEEIYHTIILGQDDYENDRDKP